MEKLPEAIPGARCEKQAAKIVLACGTKLGSIVGTMTNTNTITTKEIKAVASRVCGFPVRCKKNRDNHCGRVTKLDGTQNVWNFRVQLAAAFGPKFEAIDACSFLIHN